MISTKSKKEFPILAIVIALTFFLMTSLISLNRYWQFDAGYYDFGIFDRALWLVSRLHPPIVDHFVAENQWIFADHFYPSLFVLAPLYWFTDKQEIMFIAQSLFVATAGIFLYKYSLKTTKLNIISLSILIAFFSFVGLQNALWFDIHEVTFMVLPLSIAFFAISQNDKKLYWLSLIWALGFKESAFIVCLGLSFFIFFTNKKWKKIGLTSAAISLMYGLIVIKAIIPAFKGSAYGYDISYNWFTLETYTNLFFDSPVKMNTVVKSFLSFGGFPFFAISLWPSYIGHFLTRFTQSSIRWDLGLHYSAELAPLLAAGAVVTINNIKRWSQKAAIVASMWLIISSFLMFRFILHGPLLLAVNPAFYKQKEVVGYPETIIQAIPKTASVMAQQNLASHLTHHRSIFILRDNYEKYAPEYIALDFREGLNPAHYWGVEDSTKLLNKIDNDVNYRKIKTSQTAMLFCRRDICTK